MIAFIVGVVAGYLTHKYCGKMIEAAAHKAYKRIFP